MSDTQSRSTTTRSKMVVLTALEGFSLSFHLQEQERRNAESMKMTEVTQCADERCR